MRLHLVRHGETRHNVEKRIQGDLLDDDLNEVGYDQADALRRHYAARPHDAGPIRAVYSSPLKRARSTAAAIAGALKLPAPLLLAGVREVGWGGHMGKLNTGEILVDMTRVLDAWEAGDITARVEGGESPPEAWARASAELAMLERRHVDDEVVLVAHGRINKVMMSGLLHGDLLHMEEYPQANAGVSILDGPNPWRLLEGNQKSHLAGLRALDERVS